MKKNKIAIPVILLFITCSFGVLSAIDLFKEIGLDQEEVNSSIDNNFTFAGVSFLITEEMRKMSPAKKSEVLAVMGDYIKTRAKSKAFMEHYMSTREEGKPTLEMPIESIEDPQERAQAAKDFKKFVTEFETDYPPTINGLIARRLQQFLTLTEGIDFNTKLIKRGKFYYFEDQTLEAKPTEWKLVFRYGKDVIVPARNYAKQWLAQLPK